jgi:hypothetical protein
MENITLNLELFKNSKVDSFRSFTILTLIYEEKYNILEKYFSEEELYNVTINTLDYDGWIKINGPSKIHNVVCTQKTINLFTSI